MAIAYSSVAQKTATASSDSYTISDDGNSYTISIVLAGSVLYASAAVIYSGSSTPVDSQGASNAVTTSKTDVLTSVADNCWHVTYFASGDGGNTVSAGASTTRRTTAARYGMFDGNAPITPAGANTLTSTVASSAAFLANGATIAPGSDKIVLVGIYTDSGPTAITSVSFQGVPMTRVNTQIAGGTTQELWIAKVGGNNFFALL